MIRKYRCGEEKIVIDHPNNFYCIHYGCGEPYWKCVCTAGKFETFEEAEKMLHKHRPNVETEADFLNRNFAGKFVEVKTDSGESVKVSTRGLQGDTKEKLPCGLTRGYIMAALLDGEFKLYSDGCTGEVEFAYCLDGLWLSKFVRFNLDAENIFEMEVR